jgi:hypothetical protein
MREIAGELIIVPLTSGVADMQDEIYTLNRTGRAIWEKLDEKKNLKQIVAELSREFQARDEDIEKDVMGLVKELVRRRMLKEVSRME